MRYHSIADSRIRNKRRKLAKREYDRSNHPRFWNNYTVTPFEFTKRGMTNWNKHHPFDCGNPNCITCNSAKLLKIEKAKYIREEEKANLQDKEYFVEEDENLDKFEFEQKLLEMENNNILEINSNITKNELKDRSIKDLYEYYQNRFFH
jgi:hypothetical protein